MMMASMRQQGSSMRAMARMLGRSASTISRELGRNKVYFCDPHSPLAARHLREQQRAAAPVPAQGHRPEHDLSLFSQDELDAIADSMNNRPRATHAWHSPLKVFARTLASTHQPSAPIH